MRDMENANEFVQWLRSVAPYIHAFRGKTFVVAFPGELVKAGGLPVLAHDLSLLTALGIRIVVVHGSRPQVEEQLALRNVEARYHNGLRITDSAALECAKEAAGELRLDIEAAFSQGLPNTPMAHAAIRVISGNFVTARPMGVIDGADLQLTGVVRKIASDAIHPILQAGGLVLLSPLGFSPTGEAFNLTMEDVARRAETMPWGTADEVRDRIIAAVDRTGADVVHLRMNTGAMPHDMFMKQIRLFAEKVLPALQAHQVKVVPAAAEVTA